VALKDFVGKYLLLFFYPLDFTFVCPTEILDFSKKAADFRKHNCEILGCSVDSHYAHRQYTLHPRSEGGLGQIDFPLMSDLTKKITSDYHSLVEDAGLSLRSTFIIDKK